MYLFLLALGSSASAVLAASAWRNRFHPGFVHFALMQGAVAWWGMCYLGEQLDTEHARIWFALKFPAIALIPPGWMLFARHHVAVTRPWRWWWVLYVWPVMVGPIVLTNDHHQLFFREVVLRRELVGLNGPLFNVHVALNYAIFLAAAVMLARLWWQTRRPQSLLLLVGGLMPFLANVINELTKRVPLIAEWIPRNPTLPTFALSAVLIGWAVMHYRLLDPRPVAREALFDDLPDPVIVLDDRDIVVDANRSAQAVFGTPTRPLNGHTWIEAIAEADGFGDRQSLANQRGELMWRRAEETRWFELASRPLRDNVERPVGRMIVLRDITLGRRREDLRVKAASAIKEAIVDHAMEAIVTVDLTGTIVEFNPAAEAMFGLSRQSAIGSAYELLVPERYRQQQRSNLQEIALGATSQYFGRRWTLQALRSDGTEMTVEAVIWRSEVDGAGVLTGSMRDITEQRRSAEMIERQRNELRQSEKLTTMGSLLAGVAHELNNPLAIVTGRASLLEEKGRNTPMQEDAQRVREAAERCGRIVRTFLNMARQRASTRGDVQLNDIVKGAAEMLGYALRTNAIKVDLRLQSGLPTLCADGDQLGQVVLNLMVNAQQAMGTTSAARQLRLETGMSVAGDDAPARAWLRVVDTGPGVPPTLIDRIFSPFFTTKSEGVGTGLGLSVSRAIARDHGGDLVLEPVSQGASFLFWLPMPADTKPMACAQSTVRGPAVGAGARVLVLDDEEELLDVMRSMLEEAGFVVTTVDSATAALERVSRESFDAIVSDVRMPQMDGAAFWRAIRQAHPALARRVLFVTGDTLSKDVARFLADSGCPALDKPFAAQDLVRGVLEVLADRARGTERDASVDFTQAAP